MTIVKGKIKDFGEAPYKHDETKQQSYFVNIETKEGDRTLWSVGLKDAINKADLKKGDYAALVDKGTLPVKVPDPKEPGNYIDTKRRVWDAEAFEPDIEHSNSIENGAELKKDQQQYRDSEYDSNVQARKSKFADIEDDVLEQQLPSTIKNNYIAKVKNRYFSGEKVHFYERDSEDTTVAFEDRSKSLNTSREDAKTIKAMLDVAQSKKWSAINIKGTENFRREVWLEASIRGIEVKGYTPTEKDLVDLEKRKSERSVNQVVGDEERSQELNSKREAQSKLYTKEEDKSVSEHAKDASTAVAFDASLAVATGGKYTASMVASSIIADKAQSLVFDKLDEKYKLSEKATEVTTELDKKTQVLNTEALEKDYSLPKDTPEVEEVDIDEINLKLAEAQDERELAKFEEQDRAEREEVDIDEINLKLAEAQDERELAKFEEQDDEKDYQEWKVQAMKEQEFELSEERYRSEYAYEKAIEQEALVRSNEFDAGRDVDPDPSTEVNAEVEQFHDNLAVPTGTNMSHSEAMRKVEAAFDRKINPNQRNEVKELEEKLSNEQKLAVESWRRVVDERFKDDPAKRQEKHDALNAKLPAIISGEYNIEAPTIKQEQQIEVHTRDKGSQDRVR